jgi:hypothetical protein
VHFSALMKKLISVLGAALALTSGVVRADVISDQLTFRQLFLNEVRTLNPSAAAENIEPLHSVSDASVESMLQAGTVDEAMKILAKTGVSNIVAGTKGLRSQSLATSAPSAKSNLTIVLVPGVFAEFIATRAFEEVLEKPSHFRDEFKKMVADQHVTDSVQLLENYRTDRPASEIAANESRTLDQVINVGEMDLNGTQVRVILFYTEFSTLESLGRNQERAAIFNRRLEKYLALTGQQNLAFVGYSRGTPLGLEMLAQAKAAGRPWVADVKAMISLSGVVSGSSLADSAINDSSAPANKILVDLQKTSDSLQLLDPNESWFNPMKFRVIALNSARWAAFGGRALINYRAMDADKSTVKSVSVLNSLVQTDPRTPLAIVEQLWKKLGLTKPGSEYNENIVRFRYFVDQLLASVKELTSQSRQEWWAAHDVPLNPVYYAIPAAMANPDANSTELALFKNPMSYGGEGNYDDASLILNTLDYAKITRKSAGGNGVSLNDSQVAVAQAAFLPNAIANLRGANAGIKTKFLGIAGTHHWGMALRVVNKNLVAPGGGKNGFPREAMLRALATQVLLDN